MRFKPSFIILSLDQPGKPFKPTLEGAMRPNCKGVYKGRAENGFILPLSELDRMRGHALEHNQESILVVDNGSAYLEYLGTAKLEYLGEWQQIDKLQTESLDSYTEYNGKYFTAI